MASPSQHDQAQAQLAFIQQQDAAHHLHPFTDPAVFRQAPPFVIQSATGCVVTGQGVQLLDAMAGLGCVNIGYSRAEMAAEAEVAIRELSYYHSFAGVTNPWAAQLAGRVAAHMPAGLKRMFFANSGSEANETILKLIRAYWRGKGAEGVGRRKIISRMKAYHGSSMATTALNGRTDMTEPFGLDTSDIVLVEEPFWYRNGGKLSPADYGIKAARAIEEAIVREGADSVAAIFIEPIQGTGGAIIPPETYAGELMRIKERYGVLLVADEVLTGMGRTGYWTASEAMGLDPDFISLAKGLSSGYAPIAAAVVHDRVMAVLDDTLGTMQHGYTTSGHPVSCRLALKSLEILETEKLVERIRGQIGPYFASRLSEFAGHALVGEVRCMGLLAGIEIAKDKASRTQFAIEEHVDERIGQAALMNGLIVRPTGNTIVICPPFVISHAEIDYLVQALGASLDTVAEQLRSEGKL